MNNASFKRANFFSHCFLRNLRKPSTLKYVLFALAAITVLLNAPGHLTSDPLYQMQEGITGIYTSIHPPLMGYVLSWMNKVYPGFILFFLMDIAIFYIGVYLFLKDKVEGRIATLIVIVLTCLSPVILINNGTIWKDILFANLSLLGFSILSRERCGVVGYALAILCFPAVIMVRQQGLAVALCGALCFVLHQPANRLPVKLIKFILSFLLTYLLSKLVLFLIIWSGASIADTTFRSGLSNVLLYDVSALVYTHGTGVLTEFSNAGLNIPEYYQMVLRYYSDTRHDFMDVGSAAVPIVFNWDVLSAQWLHAVTEYPFAYLLHRWNVFSWLLGFHDVMQCIPVIVGMDGPPEIIKSLNLEHTSYPYQVFLWNYAHSFFEGFLYRPWVYGLISGLSVLFLWRRRQSAHARAVMMFILAATIYVGSYFVFSIACDFRYAYLLILATHLSILVVLPEIFVSLVRRWKNAG